MPKHPDTRAARRFRAELAKARAAMRLEQRAPLGTRPAGYGEHTPPDARQIGLAARTPARCSCDACRPTPYTRPALRAVLATELATY